MEVEPGRARRSQTRLSFDADMGELWEWYIRLPERARPREIFCLVQVGFAAMKGLARGGNAPHAVDAPITAAQLPGSVVSAEAAPRPTVGPSEVDAVRESLDALGAWGSADPGFETFEAEA